jgi:hypothetical protein
MDTGVVFEACDVQDGGKIMGLYGNYITPYYMTDKLVCIKHWFFDEGPDKVCFHPLELAENFIGVNIDNYLIDGTVLFHARNDRTIIWKDNVFSYIE